MADITNPQVIKFSNEVIRPLADAYSQLYFRTKAIAAEWTAQNMGALIPNDTSSLVDGSATDGRPPITGAMVNTLAAIAVTLIDDLELNTNEKLNQLLQIAVNPVR